MIQSVSMFMILFSTSLKGEGMDDLVRNTKALELYLQDKEDYEKYCSHLPWEQPDIDVYKEKLETQLTEQCQKIVLKGKLEEEN